VRPPFGGGITRISGLNDDGWVTGTVTVAAGGQVPIAFVYDGSAYTVIPPLPGQFESNPSQVLDDGRVLGVSGPRPFVWSAGQLDELPLPPGQTSVTGGLGPVQIRSNARDTIVGATAGLASILPAATLWKGGVPYWLQALPSSWGGYFLDVNDRGQIIGYEHSSVTGPSPFLIDGDTRVFLGTFSGGLSSCVLTRINDAGQAIGVSSSPFFGNTPVLWDGGYVALPVLPAYPYVGPRGINRAGTVVGSHGATYLVTSAYLSDGLQAWDLGTLLDPVSGAGWALEIALEINDRGQIACHGTSPVGASACLLTPIPAPPR